MHLLVIYLPDFFYGPSIPVLFLAGLGHCSYMAHRRGNAQGKIKGNVAYKKTESQKQTSSQF